ncbi:caspase family protein [Nonomuraea sp. NPDC001684]
MISRYPKAPADLGWDRPDLVQARDTIIGLFTRQLGYQHVTGLGLDPTAEQLTSQLRAFCISPERREDDLIAVYIAGHGEVLDDIGEHVLLTSDTDPDDVADALPTLTLAKKMLQKTRVRRLLLILDTCYSGQGGNQAAARALAQLDTRWGQQSGTGFAVITSAQPNELARTGALPHLLEQAVTSRATAGHGPASLPLDAVVQHMAEHPDRPGHQHIGLNLVGLTGTIPGFLLNPRHDARLTEVDLAIQQAAEWDAQAERREIEFRTRLLVRAMGSAGKGHSWWFTGRQQVVADITGWLRRPDTASERLPPAPDASPGDHAALAVTAGPGSGKTAVLGLIATLTHPEHRRSVPIDSIGLAGHVLPAVGDVDVVIYAQSLTDEQVLAGIAAAAHVQAESVGQLLNALPPAGRRARPFTVLIDALDEAATPDSLCDRVLGPLIKHSGGRLRLLLGTRPHLLERLGLRRQEQIDLDADRYADPHALKVYTIRNLMEARHDSPYWDCDRPLRARIAAAVATAAHPSFLVARITAGTLAAEERLPDPDDGAWRASLPRLPSQAMRQDLERRLGPDAGRAADLLRPLAFAEGQGLPWEDVWPAVATEMATEMAGRTYTNDDLHWLRRAAGSYVVEAIESGRSAYRLYHQALAEHLREGIGEAAVHTAFTRALTQRVPYTADGDHDWARAHPYSHHHLATHAARAGLLDDLITDTEYLVHADPDTLIPHLHTVHTPVAEQHAAVYQASIGTHRHATPETRRQILALDAARYNIPALLTALNSMAGPHAWKPVWATGTELSRPARNTMTGHTEWVYAVACTVLDGRPVAVTGSADETVRIWDLATGRPVGDPLTGHTHSVMAVACTVLGGRPVAVTGSTDKTVRVWDLATGQPVGDRLTGHTGPVYAVACTVLDGRPVAVTGSRDETVRMWDLVTGKPIGRQLTGHTSPVGVVACTVLGGRPVAVTGSTDKTVRVWDLATGQQVGDPLISHTSAVNAVACTVLDGRPVAVTGSRDETVRMWDLVTGKPIGRQLTGHTSPVRVVACTVLGGRPVAITGSQDKTVRVWDLASGQPVGAPLTGHTGPVGAVACTVVDGHPVAVTGSDDHSVRVWDLATRQSVGDPLTGHTSPVMAVACTVVDGHPVAVTGSYDVLVWDLATGRPVGDPLTALTGSVACTVVDGRPVAVTGSRDQSVQVWDLATGRPVGDLLTGHTGPVGAVACTVVDGRPVAVTGSDDYSVRVWDLATRQSVGDPLTGHTGSVDAVACTVLDGRPVAVTGSRDQSVRVWDLATGRLVGDPLTGHTGSVDAVACTVLDGRPVAVTGSDDHTMRIWDLQMRHLADVIHLPSECSGVAVTDSGLVVCAFGRDLAALRR